MGNSSTKESRDSSTGHSRSSSLRQAAAAFPLGTSSPLSSSHDRSGTPHSYRGRPSRHDISFLGLGGGPDRESSQLEARKETRQEREARKAEKERVARAKERERSMREEAVDGGYLVTLGTYVGPEDFDKSIVRQLQIERRLAPFWRGLNDHSESWTEYQLVAAARGRPIPPPDEPPPEEPSTAEAYATENVSKPIAVMNSSGTQAEHGNLLSASHPGFPSSQSPSSSNVPPSSSPLFRGRSKTFASLASSRNSSQPDISPQEIRLPHEPQINGQPVEAYLYKDAQECPICFLYYPPYLNRTRCCDQPICSECFVQIKRPDPHPPEHTDPNSAPPEPKPFEEEGLLISEPAACPFCVQNEFGVSYEPPPFRRGLAYANQGQGSSPLTNTTSAMSSSSSLANQVNANSPPSGGVPKARRRTQSLSASAPTVITTDKVRPDWAKKLSDARAQAARRSAAATALHAAAYMQGIPNDLRFGLGRRRRPYMMGEGQGGGDAGGPQLGEAGMGGPPHIEALLAALEGQGSSSRGPARPANDLFPGRTSSRGGRAEDLEELMMMEAIRQSLAAEEERKKKEEKEAKKEEKKKAKEQKKADKAARKNSLYTAESNASSSFYSAHQSSSTALDSAVEDGNKGKGKAVESSGYSAIGFNPLNEPTSTINKEIRTTEAQRHLEKSRANLDLEAPNQRSSRPRGISDTSSDGSSIAEPAIGDQQSSKGESSGAGLAAGVQQGEDPENGGATGSSEPTLNFRSLAEMIGEFDGNPEDNIAQKLTLEAPRTTSSGNAGTDNAVGTEVDTGRAKPL